MRTAFSAGLNEDGVLRWVEWKRLSQMSWMWTTFSTELNEDDFLKWVEWGRIFQLTWMTTTFLTELNENGFSYELNEDGFFDWVEWGRLCQISWMKITFLNKLNKNVFFEWNWYVLVSKYNASYACSQYSTENRECCVFRLDRKLNSKWLEEESLTSSLSARLMSFNLKYL